MRRLLNCACAGVIAGLAQGLTPISAAQDGAAGAGEQPANAGTNKDVAPEAAKALERVAAFYEKLPGVKVKAKMSVKRPGEDGEGFNQDTEVWVGAADPNKFVFPLIAQGEEPKGGSFDQFKVVSTGERVYTYIGGPVKKYTEKAATGTYEGVIAAMSEERAPDLSSMATPMYPVLRLMEGKSLAEIEDVVKVEYLGREDVGEHKTERIKLVGSDLDVEVWVRAGEQPWVEQIKPDMSRGLEELGAMGEQLRGRMPEVRVTFTGWESVAEFPEGTFTFTPPEGAEKVNSMMEAMGGGPAPAEGGEAEGGAHAALLGKAAPELNLPLLGGGEVKLSDSKGKVVVLDFWATWCPPCVKGLPALHRVTEKLKERGVVFYAINQQEDEGTVSGFLEKRKLPGLLVPMDREAKAAKSYGVSRIPQTVLIGKDGTVQAVHVGYGPGAEKKIQEQVESLLKGEKLHGGEGKE